MNKTLNPVLNKKNVKHLKYVILWLLNFINADIVVM